MVNDLDKILTEQSNRIKDLRKKRYHEIRKMGFKSTEAMILSGWNEDKVKQLAIQRGYIKATE